MKQILPEYRVSSKETTRTAVHRIASAMLIAGQEPTIRNVRAKLGRGSVSTIGPALREWRLSMFSRIRNHETMNMALPKELVPMVWELWEKAVREAGNRYNEERNELISIRDAAISQRNAFSSRCDELEKKLRISEPVQ